MGKREQRYKQKNKLIACHDKYHKQTASNNKLRARIALKSNLDKSKDLVMAEIQNRSFQADVPRCRRASCDPGAERRSLCLEIVNSEDEGEC